MDRHGDLVGIFSDGVFFTEEQAEHARLGGKILKVDISRQNSNLAEVRRRLAAKVSASGGNALVGFTYGQRAHRWYRFGWDSESWYGSGYAARID